jgi:diguanylate cyclase (GGDEF)-like protein
MKHMKLDRHSMIFRLTSLTVIIILGQAALLSLFLILGGALSKAEENAFSSFSDKVNNRKDYLQREMKLRWTNMDPYVNQITDQYNTHITSDDFLKNISESLISMLRATQATGAFVILNNPGDEKSALYIRDYDPILNDYNKRDLYMVFGPSGLARDLQIPLDKIWKYRMNLNTIDSDFYEKPIDIAGLSTDSKLLGYWGMPFKLSKEDVSIITYSMPLFDNKNNLIGIIGVEISEQHLSKYLPSTDLQNTDSFGYMLGIKNPDTGEIHTLVTTKAIQKRITKANEPLLYTTADANNSIYLLDNNNVNWKLYLSIENLGLYGNNTPFQDNQWYLIGIMNESNLLEYAIRMKQILLISFIASVIIGGFLAYFVSYRFTKPIIKVAKRVKATKTAKVIELENTGLAEVDELLDAIQITSNKLLKASGKMSCIIGMLELPVGVFEFNESSEAVFITDRIPELLDLNTEAGSSVADNKELFTYTLNELLKHPEEAEDDVYFLDSVPGKWLKVKYTHNDNSTMGFILDVTDEITEKKQMMADRDLDGLTGIYNRKAMQFYMEDTIRKRDTNLTSALLMFDLDNLKSVNDTYGHKWGDIYLKHVTKHLSQISEKQQVLGRRSGDEFTLLLYDFPSMNDIRQSLDTFYHKLHNDPLEFPDGTKRSAAISSGLVWLSDRELSFEEYLHNADELLYEAKRSKKGYYVELELPISL